MIAEILVAVSKKSSNCHADRSACKAVMRSQGLPAGYVHEKTSAELTDSEIKDLVAAIEGLGFTPE